jgi:hypothetical protein
MQTKTKTLGKMPNFLKDYNEIMEGFTDFHQLNQPPVIGPNDMFVKFSIYTQSPITITSTNTIEEQ